MHFLTHIYHAKCQSSWVILLAAHVREITLKIVTSHAKTYTNSLPADVLWGSFVTHSFLPHGRLLNRADFYVHQSQAVYGFL